MAGLRPYSEEDYMDIFGDNLVDLMEEKGFTMYSLSKESHVAASSIYKFMTKKSIPSIKSIINITRVLGCSVEELIDFGASVK